MSSIAPPAHTRSKITTDDWITPKWIIDRFGPFDLDPCASATQPWPCAKRQYTIADNRQESDWFSHEFVWCNPPYGIVAASWLQDMANHNNGIALVFARTETRMFFDHVWSKASSLLFIKGRLTFCYPDGKGSKASHNSGGPSVLIGYGLKAQDRLYKCRDVGAFVRIP